MSVDVSAPATAPCCRNLPAGMHAIVFAGRCLACLPNVPRARVDDDGGEHLIRQSGGIRRDRYGKAVR